MNAKCAICRLSQWRNSLNYFDWLDRGSIGIPIRFASPEVAVKGCSILYTILFGLLV